MSMFQTQLTTAQHDPVGVTMVVSVFVVLHQQSVLSQLPPGSEPLSSGRQSERSERGPGPVERDDIQLLSEGTRTSCRRD